ncbi:MAG: N-acetyl-gamma-glutamyl-phosphate reductase [Acholeplasmatales bacterium]|nr:N-acetyl-gamma-glutamyl-phosphate reductase [Acholeplasmatales bacterium]
MKKFKVFIDGEAGTTGLRINERLSKRDDIELLKINPDLRKDLNERKKLINQSDITFLCLPDDAARESAGLLENDHTKIIDASTAHRTLESWAYGFPELDPKLLEKIKKNQLIAVPGCYASGFMSIVYPLVKSNIASKSYPFAANAISGYSGAGKKGISQYEDSNRDKEFEAPRLYALTQMHKHLKEMKAIPGLDEEPLFNPYVCDFYNGMLVTIPLYVSKLNKKITVKEMHDFFDSYYKNQPFVRVMPLLETGTETGFLSANRLENKDYLEIYISGNESRITITACLDNLGKGASGAAIECMNIALGLDPKLGLSL